MPKVVCLGDSLTYSFGVPRPFSWAALAGKRLGCEFINKGINGDTTGGMLARFGSDVLAFCPDAVTIMGGPNDFISGLSAQSAIANISAMVGRAEHLSVVPVLCVPTRAAFYSVEGPMVSFLNSGFIAENQEKLRDWILGFSRSFGLPCVDFAEEFAKRAPKPYEKNFSDGLHPNREAQKIMADIVTEHPYFQKMRNGK